MDKHHTITQRGFGCNRNKLKFCPDAKRENFKEKNIMSILELKIKPSGSNKNGPFGIVFESSVVGWQR